MHIYFLLSLLPLGPNPYSVSDFRLDRLDLIAVGKLSRFENKRLP